MFSMPRSMKERTSSIRMSPNSARLARAIRSKSGGAGVGSESTAIGPIMSGNATPARRAPCSGDDAAYGVRHNPPSGGHGHPDSPVRRADADAVGDDLSPAHDLHAVVRRLQRRPAREASGRRLRHGEGER